MRYVAIMVSLAGVLLGGCGERISRRATTYGPQILVYEGDTETLANCCRSAIYAAAAAVREAEGLETAPTVQTVGRGFSENGRPVGSRSVLSFSQYRIETVQAGDGPVYVIVESPPGSYNLINALTAALARFDVRID